MIGDMTRPQLNSSKAAQAAVLCAIVLSALPAPASSAATPNLANLPGGCGPTPSWIEGVILPQEGQDAFQSCFSGQESKAEAVLSIANSRPYAQLITVRGAALDISESSFASALEAELAGLLTSTSSGERPSAFLLSPGRGARLVIDRPRPGPAQPVHIDPAPDNAFAVGALAWRLLSAAASQRVLSAGTERCIAGAVYGALSSSPSPKLALRRMNSCVNAAGVSRKAGRLLHELAARLLGGRSFKAVIHLKGTELHPARIAFQIAPSNPYLTNPSIHLTTTNLGTLPSGRRTVRHLEATGGTPPYRFYFVPEPGGPGVPSWLYLAPDGTLTVDPPIGVAAVEIPVEVVDGSGEHSLLTS